jgi:hypothetical protein
LREVEAPIFSNIWLTDGGKVVSPTRWTLFNPQEDTWHSFLLEAESTPRAIGRLEGLGKLKNPSDPALEPATFRLVS